MVNDHPDIIEAHIAIARAHALNKDYGLALDVLKDALKKDPDSDIIMKATAEIHLLKEDIASARAIMEERVKKHPDNKAASDDMQKLTAILVRYHFSKGEIKEAESLCRENPGNTEAWLALGSMYEQNKDYTRAMDIYEQVLTQAPDSWDAANNLAFLLAESDGSPVALARAFDLAQKALLLNPGSPYIQDTVGWIQYKRGEFAEAEKNIEAALKSIPDHPVINYHMGVIYNNTGKRAEAEKVLLKALEVKADFQGKDEAQKLLDEIK
ncbi:MAG: tetratricopeptide repeat protein [Desulfamplus sp.]|nr:tetratricopeptide repeat protein [Desulfamplus sp.]